MSFNVRHTDVRQRSKTYSNRLYLNDLGCLIKTYTQHILFYNFQLKYPHILYTCNLWTNQFKPLQLNIIFFIWWNLSREVFVCWWDAETFKDTMSFFLIPHILHYPSNYFALKFRCIYSKINLCNFVPQKLF